MLDKLSFNNDNYLVLRILETYLSWSLVWNNQAENRFEPWRSKLIHSDCCQKLEDTKSNSQKILQFFTSADYEGTKHSSIRHIKIEMWLVQNREKRSTAAYIWLWVCFDINCQLLVLNLGVKLAKYVLIFPCSCGCDCLNAKSRSSPQSKKLQVLYEDALIQHCILVLHSSTW